MHRYSLKIPNLIGAFQSIEEIQNMAVAVLPNGSRIRLKNLGEVKDSYLETETYSRLNAKSAVTVYVQKETSANTVSIAKLLEREMEAFKSRLPPKIELVTITNHKKGILAAIHSVQMTLFYGVSLVLLVISSTTNSNTAIVVYSILCLAGVKCAILSFHSSSSPTAELRRPPRLPNMMGKNMLS